MIATLRQQESRRRRRPDARAPSQFHHARDSPQRHAPRQLLPFTASERARGWRSRSRRTTHHAAAVAPRASAACGSSGARADRRAPVRGRLDHHHETPYTHIGTRGGPPLRRRPTKPRSQTPGDLRRRGRQAAMRVIAAATPAICRGPHHARGLRKPGHARRHGTPDWVTLAELKTGYTMPSRAGTRIQLKGHDAAPVGDRAVSPRTSSRRPRWTTASSSHVIIGRWSAPRFGRRGVETTHASRPPPAASAGTRRRLRRPIVAASSTDHARVVSHPRECFDAN